METLAHSSVPLGGRLSAEALFRAHAAFVASFVLRLGLRGEDVDDAVQEVFLVAHRQGGFEEGVAKPTTWLAEIALRVVSTHKRSQRRRRATPDESAVAAAVSPGRSPYEAAEQRAALERVDEALGRITIERRAVFILYEIEGESCDEIARGLSIPVGTVHSRLFTARREFLDAYRRIEKVVEARAVRSGSAAQPARGGDTT